MNPTYWSVVVLFCGFLFFAKVTFGQLLGSDSYLHLGIGQYIAYAHQFPSHSDLSYKHVDPGDELIAHSWFADTLGFLLYTLHPGLLICGIWFLLFMSVYLLEKILSALSLSVVLKHVLVCFATVCAVVFWKFHPLIFAIPLLLAMFLILLQSAKNSTKMYLLPVVMLVYVNVAGGYVFIPVFLIVLFVIHAMLLKVLAKFFQISSQFALSKQVWYGLIATLGASLISPYGTKCILYLRTIVSLFDDRKWFSTLPGALSVTNTNYAKDAPSTVLFALFMLYMISYVLITLVGVIRYRWKYVQAVQPTLFLILFFYLSFRWYRLIPLVSFLTLPGFAQSITFLLQQLHLSKTLRFWARHGTVFVICLLMGSLFFFSPKNTTFTPPAKQVAYIREHHLLTQYLPSMELVGYMYFSFFPELGHLSAEDDLFDEHDLLTLVSTNTAVPADFFSNIVNTYSINTIVSSKDTDYLNLSVNGNPQWELVYLDYSGLIFVRKENYATKYLNENSLTHIDLSRNLGFDPDQAQQAASELERFTTKYPTALALGQLASIYRIEQQFDKAEETLEKIPNDQWNYVVWTEFGRIQAAMGKCDVAERGFLNALSDRNERNISRTVLDLAVLYAACTHNKQKAEHYFKRYNSFPLPPAERERARVIAKELGIVIDEDTDRE